MIVLPSGNPITLIVEMWSFPFMVNAFRAGTIVAVLAGVVGWFMVLRRQSFAGHTLATVAFPGGAGAALLGLSAVWGYFAFCLAAALVLGLTGGRFGTPSDASRAEESAVTGTVLAFGLACGFLFVALYHGSSTGVTALLFGTFLGVTSAEVAVLAAVALVGVAILAVVGRPLLFASIDPAVARARTVPVSGLSLAFVLVLGAAAAEASQITGTLLVFALLVMPAATAQVLSAHPGRSLALTVVIGVVVTWVGLTIAYYSPYPIGFVITTLAFLGYLVAHGLVRVRAFLGSRRRRPAPVVAGGLS
jgi:zinc/manganese transport system permease protein